METFTIEIYPPSEEQMTEYVFETPGHENSNQRLDMCRLCLNLGKLRSTKYIKYTKNHNNFQFLEVELGLPLPEEVCEKCLGKLNEIVLFIKRCKESIQLYTQMQNTVLNDTLVNEEEEIQVKIENDDQSEVVESISSNEKLEQEEVQSVKETKKCTNPKTVGTTKPKVCFKCGEVVTTLVSHYKKSWSCKPSNYKCENCNLYFKTHYYLNVHQKTKHDKMIFMCDICSKVMRNPESLQRHIKQHSLGKPFICEQCGRGFSRNEYLTQHMNTHTKMKPFNCKICSRRLTTRSALSVHLKSHTKDQTGDTVRKKNLKYRDVSCNICNKNFSLPMALKIHMKTHSGKEKKQDPYFCKICHESFDNVRIYKEHMFATHTEEGEFTCTNCPKKRFISRETLKRHLLTHNKPTIPCTLCEKMFRVSSHLNRHLSLIHNINKGEPFRCKFCEKTFNLKENLTAHERIHTGEKPFACHVCGESFTASGVRKRHVRKVHGEKEVEKIVV